MIPTLVPPPEYKTTTSFYPTITNTDTDKLANIYLKKFNYKKIFHKKRMTKFNKEETIIKDLQDLILSTISTSVQKHIKNNKRNIPYKKLKTLKTYLTPTDYIQNLELQNQYKKFKRILKSQDILKWIDKWEEFYTITTLIKLPKIQNNKTLQDFFSTVKPLNINFVNYQYSHIDYL